MGLFVVVEECQDIKCQICGGDKDLGDLLTGVMGMIGLNSNLAAVRWQYDCA